MSDSEAITALVHSYARLLDAGDIDGVVALFEHSTWRSLPNGSVLHGSDAIRPVYERLMADGGGLRTRHLLTNVSVDVEPGAVSASSHSYWTVLRGGAAGGIQIALSGQYTDAFEKVDGTWRFTDRLITTDLTGEPAPRSE
jgi:ketosteroid isomerase-like protein